MKKLIAIAAMIAAFGLGGAAAFAASTDKPPSPPGQGECEHGNSQKPCKEDPQPDKGKDCEEHGNQGGVNEDHCLAGTTTGGTTSTTTTTTGTTGVTTTGTTATTTTTGTTSGSTTSTTQTSPSTTTSPPTTTGGTSGTTATPLEEELEEFNKGISTTTAVAQPGSLPYTGLPLWGW